MNFPPPESAGGWPSLVPAEGNPSAAQKERLQTEMGVNWDKLKEAWDFNLMAGQSEDASGLVVIRHGKVVGEWYDDCDRSTTFDTYSSAKSYTSVAFGLLLADSEAGRLPGGQKLSLDTKVFSAEYLPEAMPLTDPRKARVTLRHLLNMTTGFGPEPVPDEPRFEWALGKTDDSPHGQLTAEPGTVFHYSNGGGAHLVLLFNRVAGRDLFPFMKERVFTPIGMESVSWKKIGGNGNLGPFCKGYSGLVTTAREHARFCYLALHRGQWDGKCVVPAEYYEFAWQGTAAAPDYGAQWWIYPAHPHAPKDMVHTSGAYKNNGYVIPSLDLIFVRLGNATDFPENFEPDLVLKVLAGVE